MKRRIKRKVFMVGMAVSATLPLGSTAKAAGKHDHQIQPYSGWSGAELSMPLNVAEPPARDISLMGKLKSLLGGVGYGTDATSAYARDKGWRVELMRNEPAVDQAGDIRQARDKRFGLAFRMSF